jgi:hypothetical protein
MAHKLTVTEAQDALFAHANNNRITSQDVSSLLGNVSVTFAQVVQVTKVATAAAYKAMSIQKVTSANVQLFSNIKAYSVYVNAVQKTASTIADNDQQAVEDFQVSDTWFFHTDCFSVVEHKTKGTQYLYARYNAASSMYFIDGVPATKEEVVAFMTPSAAKAELDTSGVVYNKTNDIEHKVIMRTVQLDNIVNIKALGEELAV